MNEFGGIIYGSQARLERRRHLIDLVARDPEFNREGRYFMSQTELYHDNLRITFKLHEKVKELKLTRQEDIDVIMGAFEVNSGLSVHHLMFIPTIAAQGSEDQKRQFLAKAGNFEIIGTYAQTELGHGTFLRGLETTATFDDQTREFVLHSPTLTATKWWPGGLAKTSNYIVAMARLFIRGKDHGPHGFLVQIRDLNTHLPLPGITVGDIGPKFGFNGVDNGFLRFEHLRVPHSAMLTKNSQVTPKGEYVSRGPSKAAYGTMVYIRSLIVMGASSNLAKACVIATRYSAVRRQTSEEPGVMELQVLDYQNQQNQLFPLIAASFALLFTGRFMKKLYFESVAKGDLNSLPEVHATSSGLKGLVTVIASEGIESCRKACGGHGYSHLSGLPFLYEDYISACTYEGENNVMHLQTARYLIKSVRQSLKGEKLVGNITYLEDIANLYKKARQVPQTEADFLNPQFQLQAYQLRAAVISYGAFLDLEKLRQGGMKESEAWNASASDLIRASQAHCYYILVSNFHNALSGLPDSPSKKVMQQLANLFVLHNMDKASGEFLETG